MKNYYKRYFIVTHKQSFIQIQDQPVTKKYKQLFKQDIICIDNISQGPLQADVPWKHSFELRTRERTYFLLAPTTEERDLWVNGLNRIFGVAVNDPNFRPMQMTTKADLEMAEQVTMTEGNNDAPERKTASQNKLESVEEEKR